MIVRIRTTHSTSAPNGIVIDFRPRLRLVRAASTYQRQTIHLQAKFNQALCHAPARRWAHVRDLPLVAATCKRCLGQTS